MQNADFAPGQAQANPDFLDALVRASDSYSIVASRDIVDVRGLKLWARGQPVSVALQQRLLERKLMHPIESCLEATDGITLVYLFEQSERFFQAPSSVGYALRHRATEVLQALRQLPLHSVAQLMLTTMHATRPQTLVHAVNAMVLAGCLALERRGNVDVRLAMLGGLLHDIGETYIQPRYLDHDGDLDIVSHKHMMVHPRVAQLMLEGTTDYPKPLCRAIGEHHERQDGSGYPAVLVGDAVSDLGSLLAVAEVTAGIAAAASCPLARAAFALRLVHGEYASSYANIVFNWAKQADEPLPVLEHSDTPAQTLHRINESILQVHARILSLKAHAMPSTSVDLVQMTERRLLRLRMCWNALGVWGVGGCEMGFRDRFEMQLAERELQRQLHQLRRECLVRAQNLSVDEQVTLRPLWEGMALLV